MATSLKLRLCQFGILAGILATALVLATPIARAVTVLIADGQCGGTGGAGQCVDTQGNTVATAFPIVDLDPGVGTGWNNFQNAFNSWNASLAAGSKWTLATANLSAEAVFNVTIYRAYVDEGCGPTCGGAELEIKYNNGGNPPNPIPDPLPSPIPDGLAVWSQSISTNQKLANSLPGNPYLDNPTNIANPDAGPPAYPFQYPGSDFYDKPAREAFAFWLADLWISSVDRTNRILTVYDGIEWGFSVAVPLPAAWTMMLIGLSGFGVAAYRRRKKDAALASA